MGEICSLCKQAWLCEVTTNYNSWGFSPSFLIVLFFHIRDGKEMGDAREKKKEKIQHEIYNVLAITFFSLCMESICMSQSTLMSAYKCGLSYPLNGTFTGHCFPDGSCPRWEQVSWVLLRAAEHTSPADSNELILLLCKYKIWKGSQLLFLWRHSSLEAASNEWCIIVEHDISMESWWLL